jgi:Glycosyltransferase family 87
MQPEGLTARWLGIDPWIRTAVCLYLVLVVATCTRSALRPHRQSLFPVWKLAGHDWLTSHDLYADKPGGDPIRLSYRYSPLVAGLFTVCDLVPEALGNVVWRVINIAAFLAALGWWLAKGLPFECNPARRGLVFLLAAPLALGSLNNGQVNLLLIALMLAAVTASGLERWNVAALCLALAIMFKLYPVALALLLVMVYPRRLGLRLLIGLALVAAVPFLMQDPEYVARQYQLWFGKVADGDNHRRFWPLDAGYRDVWLLIRAWEMPVDLHWYTRLQLAGGASCAVFTFLAILRLGRGRETLFAVLTMAMAWMLLLGPAPESCTYVLAAPTMTVWLVYTAGTRNWPAHYLAVCGYGLLILCVIAGTYSPMIRLYQGSGLQPVGVILYSVGFVGSLAGRLLWPDRPVIAPGRAEDAPALSQAA